MATPTFNLTGANSLTPLQFKNDGMSSKLSSTGNTVRVTVGGLKTKRVVFAPVGSDWTASRTLGKRSRRVTWEVQLKAASDADLNTVEKAIEDYLEDGRGYALTDGKGRSTSTGGAILNPDATGRVGKREPTSIGAVIQRWVLAFDVMWPLVSTTGL